MSKQASEKELKKILEEVREELDERLGRRVQVSLKREPSMVVQRAEFWLRSQWQTVRAPFARRYRRARLKVLAAMVYMFSMPARFLNWCASTASMAQKKIDDAKVRRHFITDNPNRLSMPADMRGATTRLALKQLAAATGLETKDPTRKDVLEAYARAETMRGDGKLPQKATPQPLIPTAADPELEAKLADIRSRSEQFSKSLVDGLIGGIAKATADAHASDLDEVEQLDDESLEDPTEPS